jgi:hypothetical protein
VKFWDSSAVVPLLVPEVMSGSMQRLYEDDPVMVAWWATEIECTSAIARPCGQAGVRSNRRETPVDTSDYNWYLAAAMAPPASCPTPAGAAPRTPRNARRLSPAGRRG